MPAKSCNGIIFCVSTPQRLKTQETTYDNITNHLEYLRTPSDQTRYVGRLPELFSPEFSGVTAPYVSPNKEFLCKWPFLVLMTVLKRLTRNTVSVNL